MFEQSLLENAARSGWKKAMAVVISTTFQVLLLMVLVVMPLIFPESLPKAMESVSVFITVPQPPNPGNEPRLPRHRPEGGSGAFHPPVDREVRNEVPTTVPKGVDMRSDPMPPGEPSLDLTAASVGGNDPFAKFLNGLPKGPASPPPPPPVAREPKPEHTDPVRIGTLDPAKVTNRVQPIYPAMARQVHVQGVVLLEAVISKTGRMEKLHVISGHPLLVQAALDAVSQWTYQATKLNGEAVEVITTIEVRFTLNQ